MSSPWKERKDSSYFTSTCTIRITRNLKERIVKQAHWGESIDKTLRRLLSLPGEVREARPKPHGKKAAGARR